jgi:hypothetical protein
VSALPNSPYATVGAKLVDQGYAAIPVYPGTKRPGTMSRGEWQGEPDWQRFCDRLPTDIETRIWAKYPDAGVCVALGRGLVAIDVDSDDEDVQAAIRSVLPESPVMKQGRKGYTAFYQASPAVVSCAFDTQDGRALDLLAHGRQTVIPPTIHPDTGKSYVWLGDPLERFTPDQLPLLPDDIAPKLAEALAPFGYMPPPERSAPAGGSGGIFRETNDAALENLDSWVPHLGIDAYRERDGRWRGVAKWRGGDGHNVGFHYKGIRDFKAGASHTPIDVVILARPCSNGEAMEWLREKLGFKDPPPVRFEFGAHAERMAESEIELPARRPIWEPKVWLWQDPKTIARLECFYGGHYYPGEVVSTVSPGGVGKSVHSIVEALAMITGKPLLGEASRGALKVMLMNYEDNDLVLRHRVTAAMLHYNITPEEIVGKLFVESVDSDLMCFAEGTREGVKIIKPVVHALTEAIRREGLNVVTLDPWVSLHKVDGNLSHLIQPIVTSLKGIAQTTGAAIEIVAHSRKPNKRELTEDDALGSVAFVNKMRDVRVLNKMDEDDASKYGLAPWEAGDYFRVDNPKHTHRRSGRPVWRHKVSQSLGNGGPGLLDFSSDVGVVTQWSPPSPQSVIDGLEPEQIEAIKLAVFNGGFDRENAQAKGWAGDAVAKVLGLDLVDKGQKAKAKITLRAMIDAGHFEVEERPNPAAHGRTCKHLVPADPEDEEAA